MRDDTHDPPQGRAAAPPGRVFVDDLLVEAARAGWLRTDSDDPLAQVLATLHDCATSRCDCASRDRCPIRSAERA